MILPKKLGTGKARGPHVDLGELRRLLGGRVAHPLEFGISKGAVFDCLSEGEEAARGEWGEEEVASDEWREMKRKVASGE